MEINVKSFAWNQIFFFADFYENNIFSDFLNTGKRNHVLAVRSKKAAYFPRPRDHDRFHTAFACVKYNIHCIPETLTVTDVDHFLLPQFTYPHTVPRFLMIHLSTSGAFLHFFFFQIRFSQ